MPCVCCGGVCCTASVLATSTGNETCRDGATNCGGTCQRSIAQFGLRCSSSPCNKCKCTSLLDFPVSLSVSCRALFQGDVFYQERCAPFGFDDPALPYRIARVDETFTETVYLQQTDTGCGTCRTATYRSPSPVTNRSGNEVYVYLETETFLPGQFGRCRVWGRFAWQVANKFNFFGNIVSGSTSVYGTPFGWNGLLGDDNFWDDLNGKVIPCGFAGLIGDCYFPNPQTDESTITITSANFLP